MTPSRFVIAALCACGVAASTPAAATATSPAPATLEFTSAGKRALKSRSVTVAGKHTFGVGDWSVGSSAKIALNGKLRFKSGKRRADATRLKITIGRTSSYVTARVGRANVRLFTLSPTRPSVLDAQQRKASMIGARAALTRAAAKRLKSALKLRRTPSTAALGKLSVTVAPLPQVTPAPVPPPVTQQPAPPVPTPQPTPVPTPEPAPGENPCGHAPTPAGSVDWFGCALQGSSDLRSWTDYIQRQFDPIWPCPAGASSITASDGATRLAAGSAYDHRFTVASSTIGADGSATIKAIGTITYAMPAHGIDEAIGAFEIVIAPGGRTGTVYANGRSAPRDMGAPCTQPNEAYEREAVMTLDLSGIDAVTSGGVTRWVNVPATVIEDSPRIGGGGYSERPWGSLTIAVGA